MKGYTRFIVLSNLISIMLASIVVYTFSFPIVTTKADKALATRPSTSNNIQGDPLKEMTSTTESLRTKDAYVKPSPSSENKDINVSPSFDQWVSVDADVNVRSEPSLNATIIVTTTNPSLFPLLKQDGKWDLVQLGINQTGWIANTEVHNQQITNNIQITMLKANTELWDGPDQAFNTVGEANEDESYIPIEVSGNWIHLLSKDTGQSSWTSVKSVQWKSAINQNHDLSDKSVDNYLHGKTIVIDPGHGGRDTGTVGTEKPIYERDVNMTIADILADKLQAEGAHVILTRQNNDTFVSLTDRVKISNDNHADAFISIHQNSYPKDPSISGTKVYYYNPSTSETLAKTIEQAVNATEHEKQNDNEINQEELAVLHHNNQPAVLIEGCFLTNPKELVGSITPKWDDELASGIFHGLLNYFGKNPKNDGV